MSVLRWKDPMCASISVNDAVDVEGLCVQQQGKINEWGASVLFWRWCVTSRRLHGSPCGCTVRKRCLAVTSLAKPKHETMANGGGGEMAQ